MTGMFFRRLAGIAVFAGIILGAAAALMTQPARAQFVCESTAGGADGAVATGGGTVVCGTNAGTGAAVGNSDNTALGATAGQDVNGHSNTAIGNSSGHDVNGDVNIAVGRSSGWQVTGDYNTAMGFNAGIYLNGNNNVAIGHDAGRGNLPADPLNVSNTVAIGNLAVARADGAVALGNGAEATRVNQFAFGTAANTYTMAGITSAASRTAQGAPTHLVTSNAGGDLAAYTFAELGVASAGDVSAINAQLSAMQTQIDTNRTEARRGIAAAMALTTAPMPSAVGRTSWAANVAAFRGEAATGASFAHRLNAPMPLAITGGYTYGGGNAHGGRVGLQGEF